MVRFQVNVFLCILNNVCTNWGLRGVMMLRVSDSVCVCMRWGVEIGGECWYGMICVYSSLLSSPKGMRDTKGSKRITFSGAEDVEDVCDKPGSAGDGMGWDGMGWDGWETGDGGWGMGDGDFGLRTD